MTSKFVGDGEKLVRALFSVAKEMQPSIIFIDEIDSLMSERNSSEHEASRRLKTEFLVQFDGISANSSENEKVIVISATNRPWELDQAAIRRFPKRIYVKLPDFTARRQLLARLLKAQNSEINHENLDALSRETEGYSGSDLTALAKDAALMSIRELTSACDLDQVKRIDLAKVRPIEMKDFKRSLTRIRKSVSPSTLHELEKWSLDYADSGL